MEFNQCVICLAIVDRGFQLPSHGDYRTLECPRCGRYSISGKLEAILTNQNQFMPEGQLGAPESRVRANLSSYIFENQGIMLTTSNFDQLLSTKAPSFDLVRERTMRALQKESDSFGKFVEVNLSYWLARTWCTSTRELTKVLDYLKREGLIAVHGTTMERYVVDILPAGWQFLDAVSRPNRESNKAFVAMWFSEEMLALYESHFAKAIRAAGYEPLHVGKVEFTGDIMEEVIRQIRSSKFIVADFTGQCKGVYFEAGFALGMGLPVIWTCRKEDVSNCHFDTNHFNHIVWESPDDLVEPLTRRIEALLGHGYKHAEGSGTRLV